MRIMTSSHGSQASASDSLPSTADSSAISDVDRNSVAGDTPFTPSRRAVLTAGAAGVAAGAISLVSSPRAAANVAGGVGSALTAQASAFPVFQHGVASGDPLPDSILIWTRATSHPGDIAGAGQGRPVDLKWEVATDEGFGNIVASGSVTSDPAADNTVKVDVTGLSADSRYYYRFTVTSGDYTGQVTPVGHTRTAPPANSSPDHLGIALTSCANWEIGFFSAYRDMAENDKIDIIMCVGDYIYEYPAGGYAGKGPVRHHQPAHEIVSLADYRLRYATYRTDADLQEAHRTKPWIVTWDDHEVANNNYHDGAENHDPKTEGSYIARRDAAIQAYLEWLPVRAIPFSEGGHLYRSFQFGDLADVTMLDLRTYRDEDLKFIHAGSTDDETRTMLGSEQFSYLMGQWRSTDAKWRILGNSVMFTPLLIPPMDPQATSAVTELLGLPQDGLPVNLDQWDGYAAERRRLIRIMDEEGFDNVVFLTGDIHSSWSNNVPKVPGKYPEAGIAAMEIVCASVSAPNIDDTLLLPQDNPISLAATAAIRAANPYVNFLEFDRHGYAAVYVGRDEVIAEYRLVEVKEKPNQPLHIAATFRGTRGAGMTRI